MSTELASRYDPKEAQDRWYKFWEVSGYFHAEPPAAGANDPRPPYTIVIPPPNVTGALHMGHALNNTLQDILIRWRRMQGFNTLWMPGTDHAGIATQAVVERRIREQEGKTRHDLGREELVRRIWEWKDDYEKRILNQLRKLGCSCDWQRTRFTFDEGCSRAVRETFFKMFRDGLIYRGKRLVNWDTQLQTSVADDETYTEDVKSGFWTFKYPVKREGESGTGGEGETEFLRFSTTRPETMLGDTAVAVHPNDPRYKHLIGKTVVIPIANNREIPVIADGLLVDPELGTGCVKVTPAHDMNDYACGLRHKLPMINILNPDGTINEAGGKYAGMDRYKARDAVTADMEALGLFEGREDRMIPLKFSDRSKTPIEPLLSDQWFVRMGEEGSGFRVQGSGPENTGGSDSAAVPQPSTLNPQPSPGLAELAMQAVRDGRVKIHPERYAKTYLDWLGEKRDWCISRQLWWGHRISVWMIQRTGFQISDAEAHLTGWARYDAAMARYLRNEHPKGMQSLRAFFNAAGIESNTAIREDHSDRIVRVQICVQNAHADGVLADLSRFWLRQLDIGEFARKYPSGVGHAINALDVFRTTITTPSPAAEGLQSDKLPKDSFPMEGTFDAAPDVLDTWFSSQLWPHSTLGWPERTRELEYYYPTSVLVTSRDIITLWVARMVIAGLYNCGDVPFRDVYITPKILDGFGQTMSKSKGNGVDPLDIIDKYGADALRFGIATMTTESQDARLPVGYECPFCQTYIAQKIEHQQMKPRLPKIMPKQEKSPLPTTTPEQEKSPLREQLLKPRIKCPSCKKDFQFSSPNFDPDPGEPVARVVSERFEQGRNFANKLWNAARFVLMNLEGYNVGKMTAGDLADEDRWILSRLAYAATAVTEHLDNFRFSEAAKSLYEFSWSEFCDWYLEMAKLRLGQVAMRSIAQRVLATVLDHLLRLLHPTMPFLTEHIWQELGRVAPVRGIPSPKETARSVMIAEWPSPSPDWRDIEVEERFQRRQLATRESRNVRSVFNIDHRVELQFYIQCPEDIGKDLKAFEPILTSFSGLKHFEAGPHVVKPPGSVSGVLPFGTYHVPVQGLFDVQVEIERKQEQLASISSQLKSFQAKLANADFVSKAPPDVVDLHRQRVTELTAQKASVEGILRELGGAA